MFHGFSMDWHCWRKFMLTLSFDWQSDDSVWHWSVMPTVGIV